jgi:transposase InsO family protein
VKYRFIDQHRIQWPVRLMCRVLQVSSGGYYTWRDRPASAQQRRRELLTSEILAIHQEVKERYGSPRMHAELRARGQSCCVNTVAKLMRHQGIAAKSKRKFRCTTYSSHDHPVADNILDR